MKTLYYLIASAFVYKFVHNVLFMYIPESYFDTTLTSVRWCLVLSFVYLFLFPVCHSDTDKCPTLKPVFYFNGHVLYEILQCTDCHNTLHVYDQSNVRFIITM